MKIKLSTFRFRKRRRSRNDDFTFYYQYAVNTHIRIQYTKLILIHFHIEKESYMIGQHHGNEVNINTKSHRTTPSHIRIHIHFDITYNYRDEKMIKSKIISVEITASNIIIETMLVMFWIRMTKKWSNNDSTFYNLLKTTKSFTLLE